MERNRKDERVDNIIIQHSKCCIYCSSVDSRPSLRCTAEQKHMQPGDNIRMCTLWWLAARVRSGAHHKPLHQQSAYGWARVLCGVIWGSGRRRQSSICYLARVHNLLFSNTHLSTLWLGWGGWISILLHNNNIMLRFPLSLYLSSDSKYNHTNRMKGW